MSGKLRSRPVSPRPHAWIRNNILGLVAIFIALSGSAAAATVVITHSSKGKAKASKKAKAGQRGPAGPQGAAGAQGAQGPGGGAGAQGPGAVRLDFDQPEQDATVRTMGTLNELTIKAECAPGDARIQVFLSSSVNGNYNRSAVVDYGAASSVASAGAPLSANAEDIIISDTSPNAGFVRDETQIIYHNPSRVISIQLHATANDGTGRCQVQGTAVPAS
jgi:hypothetical protein